MMYKEGLMEEASRQLTVCNSCRYCEGFCDVWDAMERRKDFSYGDLIHLSNLCHDCRDCYYACPFIPPHELMINIPKVLGDVRELSYEKFVFPKVMIRVMRRSGLAYFLLTTLIFIISLYYVFLLHGLSAFYETSLTMEELFPYPVFFVAEYSLYIYVFLLWLIQGRSYWKEVSNGRKVNMKAIGRAILDVFAHKDFRGGGAGCNYPSENGSFLRLFAHASVMFGFIIDWVTILFYPFANVAVISIYLIGSVLIFAGAGLLLLMRFKADSKLNSKSISSAFTAMMFCTGASGIIFIALITRPEWIIFFLLRDSLIAALFITAPFSKFLHPVYRFASLILNRYEEINQRL
jgi:citrate/tricarballylate utilization protein